MATVATPTPKWLDPLLKEKMACPLCGDIMSVRVARDKHVCGGRVRKKASEEERLERMKASAEKCLRKRMQKVEGYAARRGEVSIDESVRSTGEQ